MNSIHSFTQSSSDFDQLVYSPNWRIRAEVARRTSQEQYLDILVNDPDWQVRLAVAFSGIEKHLAQLAQDENQVVRQEVARQRRFRKEIAKW